jgi:maltodextrin utilization protein YvdJ
MPRTFQLIVEKSPTFFVIKSAKSKDRLLIAVSCMVTFVTVILNLVNCKQSIAMYRPNLGPIIILSLSYWKVGVGFDMFRLEKSFHDLSFVNEPNKDN